MAVNLTEGKVAKLTLHCKSILDTPQLRIRDVTQILGKTTSSLPGATFGELYYRSMEKEKNQALKNECWQFW